MSDSPTTTPPSSNTNPAGTTHATSLTIGFLSILTEPAGVMGGYLVTNGWGRPLEFRLTTAVQPNKVQQILYGRTLEEFLHGELIGKTLIEKTATQPTILITDSVHALSLRDRLGIPVLAIRSPESGPQNDVIPIVHARCSAMLIFPAKYAEDRPRIEQRLNDIDQAVDLFEPFVRIRDAVSEARKTGVLQRAA